MIYLSLLGYLMVGYLLMSDRGSTVEQAYSAIEKDLTPLGIDVNVMVQSGGHVKISAQKMTGLSVQHASVESTNLLDGVKTLINHVKQNLPLWTRKEVYS